MAYDVPVRCGGVLVRPGELVFADFDGVVVLPRELEDEVLARIRKGHERKSLPTRSAQRRFSTNRIRSLRRSLRLRGQTPCGA